jgi:hypothetical protein
LLRRDYEILVDGLPRLLGEFESYRATGLLLADRRSIERIAVRGYVIDPHRNDITIFGDNRATQGRSPR